MSLRINNRQINNPYLPMGMYNSVADVKNENKEMKFRKTILLDTNNISMSGYISELIAKQPRKKWKNYIKTGKLQKDLRKIYGINLNITE